MAKAKTKTRKSIAKRFKVTKNGKIVYRLMGQNHFRNKKSGHFKRSRHRNAVLGESHVLAKAIKNSKTI